MNTDTVNQLLIARNLFLDFQEINWFVATNFPDKDEDCPENSIPETV